VANLSSLEGPIDLERDLLDRTRVVKGTAARQAIGIDGVMPPGDVSRQTSGGSPDIAHCWRNIGMFDLDAL